MRALAVQPLPGLVDPGVYVRNCYMEPLGLEYVAAALRDAGHDVEVRHPVRADGEFHDIFESGTYDVVCFSVYTYALNLCYRCAEAAKRINPDVFVVFGGHHPSLMPEETLANPAVDAVVIGEGEVTCSLLLDHWADGKSLREIPGIGYREGTAVVVNRESPRIQELDLVPWPVRDPALLRSASNYQVITPPPSGQRAVAQILYSRGCRYDCRYCTSPVMWKHDVKWRSPSSVLDEIEYLSANNGVNLFYFCDLTLNTDKDRLIELCDEFIRRRTRVAWWGLFSPDVLDAELLSALKSAGCVKLSIGVEGADPESFRFLKGARKVEWDSVARLFETAWSEDLITRGFFMIGNEWDTQDYFEKLEEYIRQVSMDDVRIGFTVPFPGTAAYAELRERGGLRSSCFEDYTTEIPVIGNRFSSEELYEWQRRLAESLYLSPKYAERVALRCKSHPEFAPSYTEHFAFLSSQAGVSDVMRKRLQLLAVIAEGGSDA